MALRECARTYGVLRAGFTGEHVRVVVMHVLHEAAVDSEHAEGLQLVAAQHRAVVTQDQLGVAVAALHEGRGGTPGQVRQRHARMHVPIEGGHTKGALLLGTVRQFYVQPGPRCIKQGVTIETMYAPRSQEELIEGWGHQAGL